MKQTRKKRNAMKRSILLLPVLLVAVVALILGAAAPNSWAEDDGDEISFEVADVYAELNDTDGDLGFHALIDGEPWKYLKIEDPRERMVLWVSSQGRLRRQGLTELFFESAEPSFDELTPAQFFRRFPAGMYEIESRTLEGDEQESEDLFRHVMPAQPGLTQVNGDWKVIIEVGGEMDEVIKGKCDDESDLYDPVEVSGNTVLINWEPVTTSHPTIGDPGDISVELYQLVVEEEESGSKLSVDLPPNVTEWMVPEEFIDLGDEFKYEILVKEEEGGNQTAVESCFVIAKED